MHLPVELQNLILFRYGGLEHPTVPIIKDWIKRCWSARLDAFVRFLDFEESEQTSSHLLKLSNRYRDHRGNWI